MGEGSFSNVVARAAHSDALLGAHSQRPLRGRDAWGALRRSLRKSDLLGEREGAPVFTDDEHATRGRRRLRGSLGAGRGRVAFDKVLLEVP